MAKLIDKKAARGSPARAIKPGPADDLDILNPDRTITIQGERITVSEYGFIVGLRMESVLATFIGTLCDLVTSERIGEHVTVRRAFGDHMESITEGLATSVGKSVEWISSLNDEDGNLLLDTWWAVNTGFFLRRVRIEMGVRMANQRMSPAVASEHLAGATSTRS